MEEKNKNQKKKKMSYSCPLEISPFAQIKINDEHKKANHNPNEILRIASKVKIVLVGDKVEVSKKQFDMFFDDEIIEEDKIYKVGTVKVVLDQQTAELLVGSKLEMKNGEFTFEHLNNNIYYDDNIVYN
jgi:Fe-S cluster assembly iron-binding protein IscA